MKTLCTAAALLLVAAAFSFAAGLPAGNVTGQYMEARTADVYTGPCFANGEADINGKEAVLGWKINNGAWNGVNIAGLGIVAVLRAEHTLGDVHAGPNSNIAALIVDSRADSAQREALVAFAKNQAGDLLKKVVKVQYAPVELTVENNDMHHGAARLTAGSLAEIRTRAMTEADHICGNEDIFYPPLTKLDHVMPAYALENAYHGEGLGETWNSRLRRSSFIGTFSVAR
jgi:hypothetical protein